jgi:hypothetical protein
MSQILKIQKVSIQTQRNATQRNATQRNATQRNATQQRVIVLTPQPYPPPAEIDDYSESPDLCLSTLPFEVSPPWSAYGTSVIAQEKFASDSLPSVLPPARVFDLGWPHVHIILKWGEETSSFDRTAR